MRAIVVWAVLVSLMFPVAIVGYYVFFVTSAETSVDPAMQQLAAANAGGPVQPFTGPKHTVYQATAPLPSADAPRTDGKVTLVWFSSTSCEQCHSMETYAQQTASEFRDRIVFVEKAVDRDTSAARYGVTATPTFVFLDASGKELSRFGYEGSAAALQQAIRAGLPIN